MKSESNLKRAVLVNAMSKYAGIVINLLFTMILARLLTPEDYGVVAVVMVFTTFFSLFSDMGLGVAVIQNKELSEKEINDIYSFTIILGVGLSLLFMLFSKPLCWFYGSNVYLGVGIVLGICLFFSTSNMIPNALLMKKKLFMIAAYRTIVEVIICGIITVVLALLGFKYYAIVLGQLCKNILTYVWNLHSTKLKFSARFRIKSIQKVIGFSLFQFGYNVVNYFARNLDNLLTGKFMGSAMLGYYDKAYKLMQYPIANLTHVITPVLHPILSDYQDDSEYIYIKYIQVIRFLALIGVPISCFCIFSSEEIIILFFGSKWIEAIPCFGWLSISLWAQMITSSIGSIFQSLNRTKELFFLGLLNSCMNVTAIVIGISTMSIERLAMCVGVCYILQFFTSYFVLIRVVLKQSMLAFFMQLWREIVIGGVLGISILAYRVQLDNVFFSFGVKLAFIGLVYILVLILTGEYKLLLHILKKA